MLKIIEKELTNIVLFAVKTRVPDSSIPENILIKLRISDYIQDNYKHRANIKIRNYRLIKDNIWIASGYYYLSEKINISKA